MLKNLLEDGYCFAADGGPASIREGHDDTTESDPVAIREGREGDLSSPVPPIADSLIEERLVEPASSDGEAEDSGEAESGDTIDLENSMVAVVHRADLAYATHNLSEHMKDRGLEYVGADNFFDVPKETGYSMVVWTIQNPETTYRDKVELHVLDMLEARVHPRFGHEAGWAMEKKAQALKAGDDTAENRAELERLQERLRHLYGHAALERERDRVPAFETDPELIARADDDIVRANHKVHDMGPMRRPDGTLEINLFAYRDSGPGGNE